MSNEFCPDILNYVANMSSDEVFTPPALANKMLDMLPQELFGDPAVRMLDPCCKSGVFLREAAKRFLVGLEDKIPDLQERIDHIMTNMLFGIAITDLTAQMSRRTLYCSKKADGEYSVATAFEGCGDGNILYDAHCGHTWENGRCVFCGASREVYGAARKGLEKHAYQFIHTLEPKELFNMQFDVIIGNPPYQLSDGGFSISATPIYHKFILSAKKLHPTYICMIVPSRWFAGGKGLDAFRNEMLHDRSIRRIVDYPEASECFSGVQIKGGVNYFLWDGNYSGDCEVVTVHNGETIGPVLRPLIEEGSDIFIRYNQAVSVYHKVFEKKENRMIDLVSSRKPFGLSTTFHGSENKSCGDLKVYENMGVSYVDKGVVKNGRDLIDEYKVFIPRAGSGSDVFPHPILGRPFVGEPDSICSETYMVIGPFENEAVCRNVISYIHTRFFRFLVMLKKVTQDTTRTVYQFVPIQDFSHPWTDEMLYEKYGLTQEEIAFIESMVRPMGDSEESSDNN